MAQGQTHRPAGQNENPEVIALMQSAVLRQGQLNHTVR